MNAYFRLIIANLDSQQLDLDDFPALGAGGASVTAGVGSGATGTTNSGNHVSSSYAAQAQHHSSATQGANQAMSNGVTRDFTNRDDFPALGGQSTVHDSHLQSPMNGYQSQQQQHSLQSVSILRNNLLQPDDKRVRRLRAFSIPSTWNSNGSLANIWVETECTDTIQLESASIRSGGVLTSNKWCLPATTRGVSTTSPGVADGTNGSRSNTARFVRRNRVLPLYFDRETYLYR